MMSARGLFEWYGKQKVLCSLLVAACQLAVIEDTFSIAMSIFTIVLLIGWHGPNNTFSK
jgi:hypothetical protein